MIRPVSRNLLLELVKTEQEWAPGILRPETSERLTAEGTVLDRAWDCSQDAPEIGARVLIEFEPEELQRNSFVWEGRALFIIREPFIIGELVSA